HDFVNTGTGERWVTRKPLAVVDLVAVVAQHPQVPHAVGVGRPIVTTGQKRVTAEGALVAHAPAALMPGIARTADLKPLGVPVGVGDDGRVVVLPPTLFPAVRMSKSSRCPL